MTALVGTRRRALSLGALLLIPCVFLLLSQLNTATRLVVQTEVQRLEGSAPDGAFEDFGVFHAAGRMVREGDGGHIYDRARIGSVEQQSWGAEHKAEALAFFNPPYVALFFVPFSLLSLTAFSLVWLLIVLSMLLAGCVAVDRMLGLEAPWQRALVYLAVLSTPAASWLLAQGQLTMFVFCGWLGFYWFMSRGEERKAGAVLVLALVKPQLLVPLLIVLVWQRRWEALRSFAIVSLPLVALSPLISGPSVFVEYPRMLLADATEAGNAYRIMFSWVGFTARVVGEPPPGIVVGALSALTVAAMAFTSRRKWSTHPGAMEYSLAALLCGSLLISPHLYRPELTLVALVVLFGARGARAATGSVHPWPVIGLTLCVALIADIETGLFMATTVILCMGGVMAYIARQSLNSFEAGSIENVASHPLPTLSLPRERA